MTFEDLKPELRRYGFMALLGLFSFAAIAAGFYFFTKPRAKIVLIKSDVEVHEVVKMCDLVDQVGDFKIQEDQRKSPTLISLPDYDVTMNEINTDTTGIRDVTFEFSDPELPSITKQISVVDTTAPEIEVPEIEMEMTKEQYSEHDFLAEAAITDNYSATRNLIISEESSDEPVDGEVLEHTIIAEDESGNIATKVIKVKIIPDKKEELSNEKDKTEAEKEEGADGPVDKENQDSHSQEMEQAPAVQPSEPAQIQPSAPVVLPAPSQPSVAPQASAPAARPKPANKKYLFTDGYNMSNVNSACMADLNASGYTGSCIPLQDSDGIYYGMELVFN
ncbi:hypothetical protein [Ileibacterium valens]|uniref:hypothetical protein n=1 Tax=Ileibacterium valens TaxID=1862668 RepID=UPI00259B9C95|nr:hypothetical protein [Ileibacterium valens]